jgi:ParB family transcriptional regulator, chromosome partitioning protein
MPAPTDVLPDRSPDGQPPPPAGDGPAAAPGPEQPASGAPAEPAGGVSQLMVAVGQLTAHPGNVREDLDLTPEFCASVAEAGVRIPLLITLEADGGYRVIEGHRRLAAAVKAGLAEVPCYLDPGRAGDQAGQFLDMVIANSDSHRRNFAPGEEAAALFAAHQAGATRTRLRKATGRKAEQIKTALQAGGLSGETRARAAALDRDLTLDDLALLAEFGGDPEATDQLMEAIGHGYAIEYVAERIRQDRAEAAEHERLRAELEAAGVPVTSDLPAGAVRLTSLTRDGEDLTPDSHAGCPGRGVFFPSWDLLHAVHYCTSPEENGHTVRGLLPRPPAADGVAAALSETRPDRPGDPDPDPDPDRRLVIEGNKAWRAAAEVRKRWLAAQLFARRSVPSDVARFVARQLLTMPDPLRSGLAGAPSRLLFSEITGQPAAGWLDAADTTTAGRVPLLMLGPIATAYEQAMSDGEGRNTWRLDRYSPCPRDEAGRYLAFLGALGHQLTDIEQAVADAAPYTGGTAPADSLPADGDPASPAAEPDPAAEPVPDGQDMTADADPGAPDSQPEDTDSRTEQAAA